MTTRVDFERLVEGFCAHCGLEQPERILHGGAIIVDDIAFSLIYSEEVNPDLLFTYADYGEVPRDREVEVYRALLQANLRLHTGRGPSLALSPESGRVVRVDHLAMAGLGPANLYAALAGVAAQARAWHSDPGFSRSAAPRQAALGPALHRLRQDRVRS